ncbi:MAG: sigma factor-like helix-turn-helix DNA-binding protein [Terracidiphilus sp.]
MERALQAVPEPYRTTLILRDVEGFVYEEVAEMQRVNLGTVKSRLVRGRAMLRTLLNPMAHGAHHARPAELRMPLGEEAR